MQFIFPITNLSALFFVLFIFSVMLPVWGLLGSICHSSPAFAIFPVMESEDKQHAEMEAGDETKKKSNLVVQQNWIEIWKFHNHLY